jgi:hypothetical protein
MLSDLTAPSNIGATLAENLERIGIKSRDGLKAIGDVGATLGIAATADSGCTNMHFAPDGAIRGVRSHSLPRSIRAELQDLLDYARLQRRIPKWTSENEHASERSRRVDHRPQDGRPRRGPAHTGPAAWVAADTGGP